MTTARIVHNKATHKYDVFYGDKLISLNNGTELKASKKLVAYIKGQM